MNEPTVYRKKPVEVRAMYLTPVSAARVVAWINSNGGDAIMRGGPKGGSDAASVGIMTLEGRIWYEPGWVIIQGVQGEFYGCRRDVFAQSYDPAEATR